MEAVHSSETAVKLYQTTRYHTLEDIIFHTENISSNFMDMFMIHCKIWSFRGG
jgi:hypothetical protein